jgi:glycosyltransferase involved in cell wall biosynthesis
MPAHNAEDWIGEAIESVLAQTHEDFELVISENASTDATASIARTYLDPRIRIEPTTKLIGPIANHNRSVQLSTGRLIKFLHADDRLLPTCLAEMIALADDDPGIGLVFAPREVLLNRPDSKTDVEWLRMHARLHESFTGLESVNDGRELFRQMLDDGFERNWIGEPTAVLAARSCLAQVGLFGLRLFQIADLDLWLRIALTHRVGYIPHPLSVYRHHDQSVTATNARVGRDWLDRLWMLEGLLGQPTLEPPDRGAVERLRHAALARAFRAQARRLASGRKVSGLFDYLWYRGRVVAGQAPRLYEPLAPYLPVPDPSVGRDVMTIATEDTVRASVAVQNVRRRSEAGQDGARPVPADPLISVCITNHNYDRYLPSAIDSVLAQAYSDVEVIVVDDGSTDGSRRILDQYADDVVVILQERAGQAAAGWAAFKAARGDVVIFLDADDVLDPSICARIADAFAREPGLALVQWRLATIDAEGRPLRYVIPPRPGLMPSGDLSEHVLHVRNWYYQLASGAAYAAWAARRVLPAHLPDGEYHALDQWLNELLPLLGPVCSLDVVGGERRMHGGSYSSSPSTSGFWPRRMIRLTLNSHEHVRQLAAELGRECPEDARDLRDPALLGWRLWSLTVDPARHPFPADRRSTLAVEGIVASLTHPFFPWRHRLKRSAWFTATAALPRSLAGRLIARYPSDGPISTL